MIGKVNFLARDFPLLRHYHYDVLRRPPAPHFHVRYGEYKAQVTIDPISILRGELPPRVFGLVAEWALVHQDELRENWKLVQNETPPNKINPLE